MKLKKGGGTGGHNGLTDIGEVLGTKDFWRLRIGIGHPGDKDLVADYVLRQGAARGAGGDRSRRSSAASTCCRASRRDACRTR